MRNKSFELEAALKLVSIHHNIICLTEHWLNFQEQSLKILEGYETISIVSRKGGYVGSCILVDNTFKHKVYEQRNITNLSIENIVECSAIKVQTNSDNLSILSIYRPLIGDVKLFLKQIENILARVLKTPQEKILLCCDLNIDFLVDSRDKINLNDLLKTFNIQNCINGPTRITTNTATRLYWSIYRPNLSNYKAQPKPRTI